MFTSKSRNTEVNAGAIRVIGVYKSDDWSADVHLSSIMVTMESKSAEMTTATNRSKAESDLEQKDEVRDNNVRSLHYLILGAIHHPTPSIVAAGQAVNKVFEKYGMSMISENYASETSLITSMLEDFTAADLQAPIAAISGFQETLSTLQTSQTAFEQARIAYETEKNKEGKLSCATDIKAALLKVINEQLVVYLRAMVQVDEATYGEFAGVVATIINDNNETVKRRHTKESQA